MNAYGETEHTALLVLHMLSRARHRKGVGLLGVGKEVKVYLGDSRGRHCTPFCLLPFFLSQPVDTPNCLKL